MSSSRTLSWVRVKLRRFGMTNASDRSYRWFDKNYRTVESKVDALRSGTVVPLDQFRRPMEADEAIQYIYARAGMLPELEALPVEPYAPEPLGAGLGDPTSLKEDNVRLRRELAELRQYVHKLTPSQDVDRYPDTQDVDDSLPPNARGPLHVFISHFAEDYPAVERIYAALTEAGHHAWWQDDLQIGEPWEPLMRHAMARSEAVVFVLSRQGLAREASLAHPEVQKAVALHNRERATRGRLLIPMRLDSCDVPAIPIGADRRLSDLACIDLFPGMEQWNRGIQRLVRSLSRRKLSWSSSA